jgi:hypothetical protein
MISDYRRLTEESKIVKTDPRMTPTMIRYNENSNVKAPENEKQLNVKRKFRSGTIGRKGVCKLCTNLNGINSNVNRRPIKNGNWSWAKGKT